MDPEETSQKTAVAKQDLLDRLAKSHLSSPSRKRVFERRASLSSNEGQRHEQPTREVRMEPRSSSICTIVDSEAESDEIASGEEAPEGDYELEANDVIVPWGPPAAGPGTEEGGGELETEGTYSEDDLFASKTSPPYHSRIEWSLQDQTLDLLHPKNRYNP